MGSAIRWRAGFDPLPQLAAGAEGSSSAEDRQGAGGRLGGRGALYHIRQKIHGQGWIHARNIDLGGNDRFCGIWSEARCERESTRGGRDGWGGGALARTRDQALERARAQACARDRALDRARTRDLGRVLGWALGRARRLGRALNLGRATRDNALALGWARGLNLARARALARAGGRAGARAVALAASREPHDPHRHGCAEG